MTLKQQMARKPRNRVECDFKLYVSTAFLKGFALQYIRIDYNVKHGNDFGEDRLFVNYTKSFNYF